MSGFQDMVAADIDGVFLNLEEFAEKHDLNGTECNCIIQDVANGNALSTGDSTLHAYPLVYGNRKLVNVKKSDLLEVPVNDQTFYVDGKLYLVESCDDDMGMLTIILIANDR